MFCFDLVLDEIRQDLDNDFDNDLEINNESTNEISVENEHEVPRINVEIPVGQELSKSEKEKEFRIENELTERENIKWRSTSNFDKFEKTKVSWFQPQCQPQYDLPTPLSFFKKYVPDSFYELAVEKTNIYALQQNAVFSPTTADEIKSLFGIHILMGNLNYPRTRYYWQAKLKIDLVSENMTVNRFYKLRQNFHVVNNLEEQNLNDRFWKVRPIFNVVRSRCLDLQLETALCVDEQMVPFRGQLSVRQYMKSKPCKYGIKIFVLCGTSGQTFDFLLYQGAEKTEINPDYLQFGAGASTVMHLHSRITEPNHQLYFDNYFSSYHLFQWLQNRCCFAAGTVQVQRFHKPPFLSDKEIKKNHGRGFSQEVLSEDGQVILCKWFDNKPVILASNFVGIGDEADCRRYDKIRREYINVPRPEVVQLYNKNMGGVDTLDFLISLYRIHIKSRKWTLRMIAHALDLAVVNSWIEYKKHATLLGVPKKNMMDLLMFRHEVAEGLILSGKPLPTKKRGRPSTIQEDEVKAGPSKRVNVESRPIEDVRYDQVGHFPNVDQKKEATRCKNKDCKKKTHVYCIKCKTHLCLMSERNCFLKFHIK